MKYTKEDLIFLLDWKTKLTNSLDGSFEKHFPDGCFTNEKLVDLFEIEFNKE